MSGSRQKQLAEPDGAPGRPKGMPDIGPDSWMNLLLIAVAPVLAALAALRLSVRHRKDAIAIALLAPAWLPVLVITALADVSRFLPAHMFLQGPAGRDQIIFATLLCASCGAVMLASAMVAAMRAVIRTARA
jgi:hypothetical protein